jgi:hypothetical protein
MVTETPLENPIVWTSASTESVSVTGVVVIS